MPSVNALRFTEVVAGLPDDPPFIAPETLERAQGQPFLARLGANENAFGASPRAIKAMREAAADIHWYNDLEGYDLRHALAKYHGVSMAQIALGAGIDELLGMVVRLVTQLGTPIVTSDGAYPTFNYHVRGFGGQLQTVPYAAACIDLAALAERVHATKAPLVYCANPDNPMGTWHDAAAILRFISDLPEDTLFILDEAYIEFAPKAAAPPFNTADPRVLRMRTFSKAHAMAGARVGYVIAHPQLITALNKIRNHFGVNRIALAGALAALHDQTHLQSNIDNVALGRDAYYRLAKALELGSVESATNFVAIDVGSPLRARSLLNALQQQGVFVRMPSVAPLNRHLRITVGRPSAQALFAEVFSSLIKGIRQRGGRRRC